MKNNYPCLFFIFFMFIGCNKSAKINHRTISQNNDINNSDDDSNESINYGSGTGSGSGPSSVLDPLEIFQWHLNNTGQSAFSSSGGASGEDINLSTSERGLGVLVAVSDNAVQVNHEDLSVNQLTGAHKNYSLSPPYHGDPSPTGSDSAHGTAVAGIILAASGNGKGGRGIASSASLVGFKFVGTNITTSKYIDQANGVYDIFNYSYGGYSCSFSSMPASFINQLKYGTETLRSGLGAIYVKAAGNEYFSYLSDCYEDLETDSFYFGNAALEEDQSYPYYILVGALDASGKSTFYSSPGSSVWISAPGGEFGTSTPAIVTTDIEGCSKGYSESTATENSFESGGTLNTGCNYTSTMNGTSSSAPMVSGVVALMLGANPSLGWRDVKYILARSAKSLDVSLAPLGHPTGMNLTGHQYLDSWRTNAAGFRFHNWYGFGGLDADAAVLMAKNYGSNLGSLQVKTIDGPNLNQAIPDDSSIGVSSNLQVTQNLKVEAVQIKVNIEHPHIGDLGIELTSPSGMKSQLMLINSGLIQSNINGSVLLSNAFFMEDSLGQWGIKVIDGSSEDTGKLVNWSLTIFGH